MTPFIVIRHEKLKKEGVRVALKHNSRASKPANADADRRNLNQRFIGGTDEDAIKRLRSIVDEHEEAAGKSIRKDAVWAVEVLLTMSPEYFRPNGEEPGEWSESRLQRWKAATEKFIEDEYGEDVITADLHLDEMTPHIHLVIAPRVGKKLCCKKYNEKKELIRKRTAYFERLTWDGIDCQRGEAREGAKHITVKEYYAVIEEARKAGITPEEIQVYVRSHAAAGTAHGLEAYGRA